MTMHMTLDRYLDLVRAGLVAAYPGMESGEWHPEDLATHLSVVSEAVAAALVRYASIH